MKKTEIITNQITLEKFAFPKVGHYELTTPSGVVEIEITEKLSHYEPGDCTVYSGTFNGVTITRKVIGYWKKQFGAVVNHRDGTATAKVLTESEITDKVLAYSGKLESAVNALNKVIGTFGDVVSVDSTAIVASYRAALIENNEKAAAEKERAEKAAAERAEKAEKRELAKVVTTFDTLQTELFKAIAEKDFTKIAELTAKMQSA